MGNGYRNVLGTRTVIYSKFLDFDITELDECRGGTPCLVLLVVTTMVLQHDGTLCSDSRHLGLIENCLVVQDDSHGLTFHGDFHFVPFSNRFVGVQLG